MDQSCLTALKTGPTSPHGCLVTFEGIDGSGKTTTIRRLRHVLAHRGYRVHTFKMPSLEAKELRVFKAYVSNPLDAEISGRVDMFALFLTVAGDRLDTIHARILPLLGRGRIVLVDRYLYSLLTELLVAAREPSANDIEVIAQIVERFPAPHLTFLHRVTLDEGRARVLARNEANNSADPTLYERRLAAFEAIGAFYPCVEIDTTLGDVSCFNSVLKSITPELIDHADRVARVDYASDTTVKSSPRSRNSLRSVMPRPRTT